MHDAVLQSCGNNVIIKCSVVGTEELSPFDSGSGSYYHQRVTFRIFEVIKGNIKEKITIDFFYGVTSCDLVPVNFRIGEKYLLSVKSKESEASKAGKADKADTVYYNGFCNLRKKL